MGGPPVQCARVPAVEAHANQEACSGGATDVLYLILFVLVVSAAAIWLFFYLLQHEIFGPAARARRKAQVADQRSARMAARGTPSPVSPPAAE